MEKRIKIIENEQMEMIKLIEILFAEIHLLQEEIKLLKKQMEYKHE